MVDSYVFTGLHFVTGKYKISNEDIKKYIDLNHLEGFDSNRIASSEEFKSQTELDEFSFLCEKLMGFKSRYHVVPFPPNKFNFNEAENTVDLCVKAIDGALKKAELSGNEIDAWFVSTATPTQYAPGITEFVKSYFTDVHNQKPTYSLTSACVGFNINLEFAINYFKSHPEAKHIILAHSEVMSGLLCEERDFVPFVTFGDSSAAVVLSKIQTDELCGITEIINHEDLKMIDFLGADSYGNLIMNPRIIKQHATPNIYNTFINLLKKTGWKKDEIDLFIPHQTGNAIVDSVAKALEIPKHKLFKEIQINYGNLSGASIPAALSFLNDNNQLEAGMKILTSVAGLGGEYGGFSYLVPEKQQNKNKINNDLLDKSILITGASGGLGNEIAIKAALKSCSKIFLQYNSNENAARNLKENIENITNSECYIIQADLTNKQDVIKLKNFISNQSSKLDYIICTHAIPGPLAKASEISIEEYEKVMNINYYSVKNLIDNIHNLVKESIVITGSVGEDAQFPGSAPYVGAKRALRAYAREIANKLYNDNIKCIYYLPGVIDSGMVNKLSEQQIKLSLLQIRQQKLTPVKEIAERILQSAYRINVPEVRRSMESKLIVIKDSYLKF